MKLVKVRDLRTMTPAGKGLLLINILGEKSTIKDTKECKNKF